MTRILYIPTNRSCVPAIHSGTAECVALAAETHQEHLFLLVEHDDGDRVAEHSAALDEDRARYGVPVLHVTVNAWRRMLSGILAESGLDVADRDRVGNLLSRQEVAYGVGPNKAFLVSAALGMDTVHRRDSDHLPDTRDGGPGFPGLLETRAIGYPVREVSPITNVDAVAPEQWDQIVLFTGSGMFGDPPHDRQELISAGEEFGVRVLGLSSPWMSPENLLRDVRGYFVGESTIRYDDDFTRSTTAAVPNSACPACAGFSWNCPRCRLRTRSAVTTSRRTCFTSWIARSCSTRVRCGTAMTPVALKARSSLTWTIPCAICGSRPQIRAGLPGRGRPGGRRTRRAAVRGGNRGRTARRRDRAADRRRHRGVLLADRALGRSRKRRRAGW